MTLSFIVTSNPSNRREILIQQLASLGFSVKKVKYAMQEFNRVVGLDPALVPPEDMSIKEVNPEPYYRQFDKQRKDRNK